MTILDSIILGTVEGLTEFIPVSSTGHLIITKSLLNLSGEGIDNYLIVVQLGALLAAVLIYQKDLLIILKDLFKPQSEGFHLLKKLLIAFFPAAIAGLLFEKKIDLYLFAPITVAFAFILGGIVMCFSEKFRTQREIHSIKDVSLKDSLIIGLAQCFSLWPGMSRSMTTIVGGQIRGCNNNVATHFSFLLAIPVLGAATVYKLLKHHHEIMESVSLVPLLVGLFFSFVVGFVAIKSFIRAINHFGLRGFGIYRIIMGLLILLLIYNNFNFLT